MALQEKTPRTDLPGLFRACRLPMILVGGLRGGRLPDECQELAVPRRWRTAILRLENGYWSLHTSQ